MATVCLLVTCTKLSRLEFEEGFLHDSEEKGHCPQKEQPMQTSWMHRCCFSGVGVIQDLFLVGGIHYGYNTGGRVHRTNSQ